MLHGLRPRWTHSRGSRSVKFDYYVLNTYEPAMDGTPAELYQKLIEQLGLRK